MRAASAEGGSGCRADAARRQRESATRRSPKSRSSRVAPAAARCKSPREAAAPQPGDVLQQHREGQGAKMAADVQRLHRLHQSLGHPPHGLAPRHTPLGAPVVPEVKVILAVPVASHRRRAGRRSSTSASFATVNDSAGACGQPATAAGTSSASAPAARSACPICSDVKNTGSGTWTMSAREAARSATTQATELSSKVASTRTSCSRGVPSREALRARPRTMHACRRPAPAQGQPWRPS